MTNRYISMAERLTDIYITLMLLVFPLFTGFEGYANITRSKFLFFAVISAVWLLCASVLRLLSREKIDMGLHQRLALAFALWAFVSWGASPHIKESLLGASRYDGLITQLLYVGIFIGVSTFGRWKARYAYFVCLSALGCTAVAVAQIGGSTVLFPNDYTYYDTGVKYVSKFLGTIGNTNLLAAFLSITIPLTAAAAVFGYKYSLLLILASAGGAMLLSFTESAGGMVALAAAAMLCAPKLAKMGVLPRAFVAAAASCMGLFVGAFLIKSAVVCSFSLLMLAVCVAGYAAFRYLVPTEKHCRAVSISIVVGLIIALITAYFWQGDSGAVYELSQLLHGHVDDDFGSSRIRIWRETLALVPEGLFFGGGPDTLSLRLELEFTRYFPELGKTLSSFADNAHNVYLGYLVNLGLPALLIYLTLIAYSLRRIILSSEIGIILPGCALVCALAENFFGLGLCLVSPIMWVIWGLVFAEQRLDSGEINHEQREKENSVIHIADGTGTAVSDT